MSIVKDGSFRSIHTAGGSTLDSVLGVEETNDGCKNVVGAEVTST